MKKIELRNQKIDEGYTIEEISKWRKVSQVGNLTKYDISLVMPSSHSGERFVVGQIIVENDDEENENVEIYGKNWEIKNSEPVESFREKVRQGLNERIGTDNIFASSIVSVDEEGKVALCNEYVTVEGVVSENQLVVTIEKMTGDIIFHEKQ